MRSYILDTHALVWYLCRPARLGRAARRALREVDAGRAGAWIPTVVAAELSLIHERGRSRVGVPELWTTLERNAGLGLLPLVADHVKEFALLRGLADPFDRLIVAAARVARCALMTADATIADSGLVEVIWD